jgi:hypothetical protein
VSDYQRHADRKIEITHVYKEIENCNAMLNADEEEIQR